MLRLVIAKAANLMSGQAISVAKTANKVAAKMVASEKQTKANKEIRKSIIAMFTSMADEPEEEVTE